MKIDKLKPGMVVYDVHSYQMGNTTLKTVGVWKVRIIAVDRNVVEASWNGNPPRLYFPNEWRKWRTKEPVLIDTGFCGQERLATRAEITAMKSKV